MTINFLHCISAKQLCPGSDCWIFMFMLTLTERPPSFPCTRHSNYRSPGKNDPGGRGSLCPRRPGSAITHPVMLVGGAGCNAADAPIHASWPGFRSREFPGALALGDGPNRCHKSITPSKSRNLGSHPCQILLAVRPPVKFSYLFDGEPIMPETLDSEPCFARAARAARDETAVDGSDVPAF